MTEAVQLAPGRYRVRIADITVGARHRQHSDVVDLRESIRRVGLLHPITITTSGRLVAGRHRLEAVTQLGEEKIDSIVRDFDDLEAELAEIDENLLSHRLTVMEEGEHLSRRNELLRVLGLRQGDGRPANPDTVAGIPAKVTTAQLGEQMRVSERTVQRRLHVDRIDPEVRDALRATPLANSQKDLLTLAGLPAEKQREVAARVMAGEVKSVAAALRPASVHDDEQDPPEGWDDSDVGERLQPVRVVTTVYIRVPSGKARVRGDKVYPRESEERALIVVDSFDPARREQGVEGWRKCLTEHASKLFHDPEITDAWSRLP